MKAKLSQKNGKLLWVIVGVVMVVVGLGFYAVRTQRISDETEWQLADPEMSDEEIESYRVQLEPGSRVAQINEVGSGSSELSGFELYCLGPEDEPASQATGESNPNDLVACSTIGAVQDGGCVVAVLSTPRKAVVSCQQTRAAQAKNEDLKLGLLENYGIDLDSVSVAGCKAEARRLWSWKRALVGPECQPGLLYNQRSLTGGNKANINISNMHKCNPGLAGRKHPQVKTASGQVIDLNPGHPDKNWVVPSAADGPAGLQHQLDYYRSQGAQVSWVEYQTSPKGACECRTERPMNIVTGGKKIKYCAKTGPEQVQITGSKACAIGSKPMFCCPDGKKIVDGACM